MTRSVPTMPLEKFRAICRNLLAKTKARQVNWIRNQAKTDPPETGYFVLLPESRVMIAYGLPLADVDYVSLRLQNAKGETLDSWTVEEPDFDSEHDSIDTADPDGNWRLLSGLFKEVHLAATGWDKVLSDVEKALASPGPIGQPAKK